MLNGRRRFLALGALAAVLAIGAGAAVAATGAADDGFLAGVAKRLGVTEAALQNAVRDESLARIDQAEQDGDLTEEQAERARERAREGGGWAPFGRGFGFGHGPGGGLGHVLRGAGNQLEAAADYLGLTQAQLREELSDGDSLADVAKAKGKSVDGLKDAMRKALRADLDQAVEDDVLTKAQADELYAKLSDGIDRLVDNGFRLPKAFGPGFGFGLGNSELQEAAADYLGLTEDELEERLSDGDSLAEIAKAEGKTVAGLQQALRKALRADLDAAVAKGTITKAQADDLYEHLSEHVDRLVEGAGRFGFRFRGAPGGGFGFEFGSPGGSGDDSEPARYEQRVEVQVF